MIRQAHSYLAGAVSGTVLIAVAVVAVVVFVSAQALKSWPIAGLGGGKEQVSVEAAQPAPPATSVAPAASAAGKAADRSGSGSGAKGQVGSQESAVRSPAIAEQENTGNGGGGSGNSAPGGSTSPGGDGSSSSQSGGGGSSGSSSGTSQPKAETRSPSTVVTDTVNEAVKGADEALGGALGESGIPKATQGVSEGLVGPTSPVGQVLDETAATVEGLLTPHD